ncbi:helix-turn-helix domain-containing protein [Nocardia sp. NPDC056000]|uniref:helix-turn-helix domain-containing protein n=1 Tax=Nocardia sp. NPDC056000 TaxID=3345674 RepID=UPI0035D6BDBC
MGTPFETPLPSQSSRFGAVSGFLLKLLRESAQLTQNDFAELLRVDPSTVYGWESGRRPLAALRAGDLTRIRMLLIRHGAPPAASALLIDSLEADIIIGDTLETALIRTDTHPLAINVHQRTLANLITWPMTGRPPMQAIGLLGRKGRGPRPDRPLLPTDDRRRFFDNLLLLADKCGQPSNALLRRQAIYLLGFDDRTDSTGWLADELGRALRCANNTGAPGWLRVRSSAIALAATGDREPLHTYLTRVRNDDAQEITNLNYYAYWVGELGPAAVTDDSTMIRIAPSAWSGDQLLRHLLVRLRPGTDQADLYARTLADLIASHPHLLAANPTARETLAIVVEQMRGDSELMPHAQRDLANVAYAIRLARR